jgi:F-type H+-transporting ATPase subunit epsilon
MQPMVFELVTPEEILYSAEVGMVVIPGEEGNFGVLGGHAPIISLVRPGVIEVYSDAGAHKPNGKFFVAGGFCEATPERCTMLAEESMVLSDLLQIDIDSREQMATKALEKARKNSEDSDSEIAISRAEKELQIVQVIREILHRGEHHE